MPDSYKEHASIAKGRGHRIKLWGSARCDLTANPRAVLFETDHHGELYLTPEQATELRDGLNRFIDDATSQLTPEAKSPELGPFGCKCQTLHHRMTGDGCEICNPELAAELSREDD